MITKWRAFPGWSIIMMFEDERDRDVKMRPNKENFLILLSCYWWSPCATSSISSSYVCIISFSFSHSESRKRRAVFRFPKRQSWFLHEKPKMSLWKSKEGTLIFWKKSWQRTMWWWKYKKLRWMKQLYRSITYKRVIRRDKSNMNIWSACMRK